MTDINSAIIDLPEMPIDIMGLFFFAYRDFVRDADDLLFTKGMGRAHHRVLYFTNLRPGMTVAELLDILLITKQSLARVLRHLIDEEYILQRTGDTDRRQRLLYPTIKGRELFKTLSQIQAIRVENAISGLPENGREAIKAFFIEMTQKSDTEVLNSLSLSDPQS